jgi:hypothetical protein
MHATREELLKTSFCVRSVSYQRVCVSLGSGSINTFPQQRRIVGGVFYSVRVVSKERRRLVLPRTPYLFHVLLYPHAEVRPPSLSWWQSTNWETPCLKFGVSAAMKIWTVVLRIMMPLVWYMVSEEDGCSKLLQKVCDCILDYMQHPVNIVTEPEVHRVRKMLPLGTVLRQKNRIQIYTVCLSKINFLISIIVFPKWLLPLKCSNQNSVCLPSFLLMFLIHSH